MITTISIIETLQKKIHQTNIEKGWWDEDVHDAVRIALMHSELSEALEALRTDAPSDKLPGFSGVEEELADTVIRILDYADGRDLRLAEAILAKLEYNKTRLHKHGGKKF